MKRKKFIFLLSILLCLLPSKLFAIELSSPNAILIEMESGKILYEKDATTRIYPASTTKIVTAILAIENCDLQEPVTAGYDAVMSVPYDGTTAAIQVGETWTVGQLVDASLVCSANEAANILAEHIGGNMESFASMMNTRAQELGAENTHFINPSGLHNNEHYSTVRDMVFISRYAMMHLPAFRQSIQLEKFYLPPTSIYDKDDRSFSNTNKMILPSSSSYYPYATGIKTGYTDKALHCVIVSAEKDGVALIAGVYGSIGTDARTNDAKALLDYGFEMLKSQTFLTKGELIENVSVADAADDTPLMAVASCDVIHAIPTEKSLEDYTPTIEMYPDLKAPIASGETIGTITYSIEGTNYQYDIIASRAVESFMGNIATVAIKTTKAIGKVIFWAVLSVVGIFIGLIFLRASILTKRQRTRSRRVRMYNSRFR